MSEELSFWSEGQIVQEVVYRRQDEELCLTFSDGSSITHECVPESVYEVMDAINDATGSVGAFYAREVVHKYKVKDDD